MSHRLAPLGALLLLPFAVQLRAEAPDPIAADRAIATLLPEETLAYVDASGLAPVLRDGFEHALVRNVLASEIGRVALGEAEATARAALAQAEAVVGRPPLETLHRLTSNGLALGVVPTPNGERDALWVLVLRGDDPELLTEVLTRGFDRLEEEFGFPGVFDRPLSEVRGADVWFLGEDLMVAKREGLLVVGNDRDYARRVLELAADAEATGLGGHAAFAETHAQRVGDEALWGWLDLDNLRRLEPEKYAEFSGMNANPGAQALLGSGISAMGTGDDLALWVTLGDDELVLGAEGAGLEPAEALVPSALRFAPPRLLAHEDDVAHGLLYRDYAAFVRERVDLFPPETLPEFSSALSGFSLFFGGRDFGEDVLPGLSPWIRVVAREIEFPEAEQPENPLPALVLIAELEDPDRLGPEVVTAFQTLIGILNADRAQKQGGMMRLRLALEGDVEVSSASFLAPAPGDGVDLRYNLAPACAVVGRSLVLGTHVELVRAVVRELGAERELGGASALPVESLELAGSALAEVIQRNFETLVMQKVLDDGVSMEEAEGEITGLRLLLASIATARFEVGHARPVDGEPGKEAVRARLALRLEESSR